MRLVAALPLPALHALARFVGWLAFRVFPYREAVVRENLRKAFPEFDEAGLRPLMRDFYRGYAEVFVEIVKAARLPAAELRRRVRLHDLERIRAPLGTGQPVLLLAAHQCNWEWLLLAISLELGFPVDAAYKPLVDRWADREMLAIRSRFGCRLVPADEMLADVIRRRGVARAIALLADQEPVKSERKHWTRFLNRDSAFFLGAEEIARSLGYPVFFVTMRRTGRGIYEARIEPLAAAGERLPAGEITVRYARRVEQQIREAPADWPWSHKRWRLKKSLYGRS